MQYIRKALVAGKAVLSEKPIATSTDVARDLVQAHAALEPRPVWFVGENFRFEPGFSEAARLVGHIGPLKKMDLVGNMGMRPGNPCALSDHSATLPTQQHARSHVAPADLTCNTRRAWELSLPWVSCRLPLVSRAIRWCVDFT